MDQGSVDIVDAISQAQQFRVCHLIAFHAPLLNFRAEYV
jgi:hypothetical protein